MNGILYIVATPIGNLEDMTLRALRILKEVDLIACEDTRVTKKLLLHYSIGTQTTSLHHHSDEKKINFVVNKLKEGKNIAYVSDAGTPGVSDPGNKLVEVAVENGIKVVAIPGPSALNSLISVAGVDMQKFTFFGFPPHKKGRETFFRNVLLSEIPVVYYESPHRLIKNLELLQTIFKSEFNSDSELNSGENFKRIKKNIIIGRELTKMFEEVIRGDIEFVLQYYLSNPAKVKGEIVIIVC